ncbi:MAG TPA: hypothetical protein VFQ35_15235 [Polyangiaceae bacterium]|nr:hypothetical protein [Polyangiaceae bacterium]
MVSSAKPGSAFELLFLFAALACGIALFATLPLVAGRTSLRCERSGPAVSCAIQTDYFGWFGETERIALRSVSTETHRTRLRNSDFYSKILVLNSTRELSGSKLDPDTAESTLRELLAGGITAAPPMVVQEPSHGLTFGLLLGGMMFTGLSLVGLKHANWGVAPGLRSGHRGRKRP